MATGDLADSAGMDVVPSTDDVKQGYDEINKSRDYLADHMLNGGHAWSKITSKPFGAFTISDSAPTGGADGDVWLEY